MVRLGGKGLPMILKQAEIAGLQPPEIAAVLVDWRDHLDGIVDVAGVAYDKASSLPVADVVGTLHRLHQVFVTTIPAVAMQRDGWRDKLDQLLQELQSAGVLD